MEITRLDRESPLFPAVLREIPRAPKHLYCIGDVSLLSGTCAAVVGSRRHTIYGKQVAVMIGRMLAENGITVVSGMAKGIDSYAHKGALMPENGKTIAVLGTAIGKAYPASNQKLMEEIEKRGLVISEYPPDFPGSSYGFPARNRIISGLSQVTIVVEAGLNSGSLITAQLAGEQGRTVYAVPGNINRQFSIGTNLLIRDGASPLVVIEDVIREMGVRPADISGRDDEGIENSMGEDEIAIYRLIRGEQGLTPDQIGSLAGLPVPKVNGILTVLEIKGAITTSSGRIFLGHI